MLEDKKIALIVALKGEARPIIKKLGLKRTDDHTVQIYSSRSIVLIITGVGRENAQKAATVLMEGVKPHAILNFGICGSSDKTKAIGDAFYINKVHDSNTDVTYYPDSLIAHSFGESGIITYDKPQVKHSTNLRIQKELVDMEAATICKELGHIISWHNVHIVKIVSDYMEGGIINKKLVHTIVNNISSDLIDLIKRIRTIMEISPCFNATAEIKYNLISNSLKLSSTQRKVLKRVMLHKISTGDLDLTSLDYMIEKCNSFIQDKASFLRKISSECIK